MDLIGYTLSAALFLLFVAASWGLAFYTFVLASRLLDWDEQRRDRAMRYRQRTRS